jgi:serine/threonine protein kinase
VTTTSVNGYEVFRAPAAPSVAGYLVLDRIGDGGQCRVWRARRRSDGLEVAIKELRFSRFEEGRERMFRAAAALRLLTSVPSIERLVTVCMTQAGAPCMVTRYVEGQPLSKHFATGADRSTAELVLTFVRIATALAEVHRHALVHRDVTPANVLVSSDYAVTLIDFGIALAPGTSRLTGAGAAPMGTPNFQSPEQMTNPTAVDHRSDVWQFGAVLDLCRSGVRAAPDVRDLLDRVVMACRRSNREERPQSLTPIAQELRQILASLVSKMEGEGADNERLLCGVCRLEVSPEDGPARDRLVALWRDRATRSPAEAVSALTRALELRPEDLSLREQLAAAHVELARMRAGVGGDP